jgi:hypothetical protein
MVASMAATLAGTSMVDARRRVPTTAAAARGLPANVLPGSIVGRISKRSWTSVPDTGKPLPMDLPTRTMSGSSRSAALSARAKLFVCGPTSRWLIMQRSDPCTNSMGSSSVMMWSERFLLIQSTIAASVVDLPEPVGPVTSTSPFGSSERR